MNVYKKNSHRNKNKLVLSLCCFVYMLLCIVFTQKCNVIQYIILGDVLCFIEQIINIVFYGTKEAIYKIYLFPNTYLIFSLKYNSYCKAYVALVYKK